MIPWAVDILLFIIAALATWLVMDNRHLRKKVKIFQYDNELLRETLINTETAFRHERAGLIQRNRELQEKISNMEEVMEYRSSVEGLQKTVSRIRGKETRRIQKNKSAFLSELDKA